MYCRIGTVGVFRSRFKRLSSGELESFNCNVLVSGSYCVACCTLIYEPLSERATFSRLVLDILLEEDSAHYCLDCLHKGALCLETSPAEQFSNKLGMQRSVNIQPLVCNSAIWSSRQLHNEAAKAQSTHRTRRPSDDIRRQGDGYVGRRDGTRVRCCCNRCALPEYE